MATRRLLTALLDLLIVLLLHRVTSTDEVKRITVTRLNGGDEFTNPTACGDLCPTDSSPKSGDNCTCKCRAQFTWRQDVGACVKSSGCGFTLFSGVYITAMTFPTLQDNPLLPANQALHNKGLLLHTNDVYRIEDFHVLGSNPWEKPKNRNADDFYTDFVQDGGNRVQKLKSRTQPRDLDSYEGTVLNFTLSYQSSVVGCLMVKIEGSLTYKPDDFSPPRYSTRSAAYSDLLVSTDATSLISSFDSTMPTASPSSYVAPSILARLSTSYHDQLVNVTAIATVPSRVVVESSLSQSLNSVLTSTRVSAASHGSSSMTVTVLSKSKDSMFQPTTTGATDVISFVGGVSVSAYDVLIVSDLKHSSSLLLATPMVYLSSVTPTSQRAESYRYTYYTRVLPLVQTVMPTLSSSLPTIGGVVIGNVEEQSDDINVAVIAGPAAAGIVILLLLVVLVNVACKRKKRNSRGVKVADHEFGCTLSNNMHGAGDHSHFKPISTNNPCYDVKGGVPLGSSSVSDTDYQDPSLVFPTVPVERVGMSESNAYVLPVEGMVQERRGDFLPCDSDGYTKPQGGQLATGTPTYDIPLGNSLYEEIDNVGASTE